MPEPTPSQIESLINALGLKIGNDVRSGANRATGLAQLYIDANGKLATGFPVTATQPTSTEPLLTLTGASAAGILTNTVVSGADVTTATKAHFVRVNLTDSAGVITAGNFYMEVFTIT